MFNFLIESELEERKIDSISNDTGKNSGVVTIPLNDLEVEFNWTFEDMFVTVNGVEEHHYIDDENPTSSAREFICNYIDDNIVEFQPSEYKLALKRLNVFISMNEDDARDLTKRMNFTYKVDFSDFDDAVENESNEFLMFVDELCGE